jgi:hypothetical protein
MRQLAGPQYAFHITRVLTPTVKDIVSELIINVIVMYLLLRMFNPCEYFTDI